MILTQIQPADGLPIVLIGLSRDNARLLLAGRPIEIEGGSLGVPADICIIGDETDAKLYDTIREAVGDATTTTYTCCPRHAAETGVPHRPGPNTVCPQAVIGG